MFYSADPLLIALIPAVLAQYIITLFCLVKLLNLGVKRKKFWIWNFFILLVPFIGIGAFLVCYYAFKKEVFSDAAIFSAPVKPEQFEKEDNAPQKSEQGGENESAQTDNASQKNANTHRIPVTQQVYEKIVSGQKTVEAMAAGESGLKFKQGDTIIFRLNEIEDKTVEAVVLNSILYPSLEDLLKDYPLSSLGAADKTFNALLNEMREKFSPEQESLYGAAAIEFKVI